MTAVTAREGGPDDVAALATLWAQAEARRKGDRIPAAAGGEAIAALRARLSAKGAVAVVCVEGEDGVVAGCFATQALVDGAPAPRLAHVSGLCVRPDQWGRGLATLALDALEAILVARNYEVAQLHVLESNHRARSLYERLGWALARTGEPHELGPHAVYEKQLHADEENAIRPTAQ